eukprot:CAMPEP_0197558348 /NCGR_PEP_ID=MMETSP1320-20131121/19043_1 /TAXON_ID=91990 /ORGANISM="Bolidomonas sp., Strain RCC2347" /LENGTH=35 /DNA_ID= /DNA_START= /DNA_END= /DNA_ORIENTATION=
MTLTPKLSLPCHCEALKHLADEAFQVLGTAALVMF